MPDDILESLMNKPEKKPKAGKERLDILLVKKGCQTKYIFVSKYLHHFLKIFQTNVPRAEGFLQNHKHYIQKTNEILKVQILLR